MINSILFGRDFTLPIKPLVFVAAIGGTAVAAAIGVNVFLWQDEVKVTLTATPTPAQAPAKTASPEITAETPPSCAICTSVVCSWGIRNRNLPAQQLLVALQGSDHCAH